MNNLVIRFSLPITAQLVNPANYKSKKEQKKALAKAKEDYFRDFLKTTRPQIEALGVKITNDRLPQSVAVTSSRSQQEALAEWCQTNSHSLVEDKELAFSIHDDLKA